MCCSIIILKMNINLAITHLIKIFLTKRLENSLSCKTKILPLYIAFLECLQDNQKLNAREGDLVMERTIQKLLELQENSTMSGNLWIILFSKLVHIVFCIVCSIYMSSFCLLWYWLQKSCFNIPLRQIDAIKWLWQMTIVFV